MSEKIKILIIPDTELDGFEREDGGGVLIHMFYTQIYVHEQNKNILH